jgi:MFS family permease
MTSESASVTAGALGNANPAYRGATMALHSMLGFAGGVFGPVAFGAVLDAAGGGAAPAAWAWAFAVIAAVTLLGPLALLALRPNDLPGDGSAVPIAPKCQRPVVPPAVDSCSTCGDGYG